MPASAAGPVPLVVKGARKTYGTVKALDGAGFDVRAGELLGLLGPNGAGKTTVIRAIAGRLQLDAGTIELFGRPLAPRDPRPEIGVVPQELAVYPRLTARENLEVFGALYGVPDAALTARVDWALTWSDLADRARDRVEQFSGGMRRRLNIACSLLHEPKIVLLDEPTVGVDPQSRERIYEMLGALRQAGVSIVLTTHHLEEAEQRCDRIVIIDHGRIVAAGSLASLLQQVAGPSRLVEIRLRGTWPEGRAMPPGLALSDDRRLVRGDVRNVASDLPAMLDAIARAGGEIDDLALRGATLHDAFIALTGRELRE